MIRVPVNPVLLRWVRDRAGIAQEELTAKSEAEQAGYDY